MIFTKPVKKKKVPKHLNGNVNHFSNSMIGFYSFSMKNMPLCKRFSNQYLYLYIYIALCEAKHLNACYTTQ